MCENNLSKKISDQELKKYLFYVNVGCEKSYDVAKKRGSYEERAKCDRCNYWVKELKGIPGKLLCRDCFNEKRASIE